MPPLLINRLERVGGYWRWSIPSSTNAKVKWVQHLDRGSKEPSKFLVQTKIAIEVHTVLQLICKKKSCHCSGLKLPGILEMGLRKFQFYSNYRKVLRDKQSSTWAAIFCIQKHRGNICNSVLVHNRISTSYKAEQWYSFPIHMYS